MIPAYNCVQVDSLNQPMKMLSIDTFAEYVTLKPQKRHQFNIQSWLSQDFVSH